MSNYAKLRKQDFGKSVFDAETLKLIVEEQLWKIWVPKTHGGLELTLTEGLKTLQQLASIDGSLGWTVTLCSGANYFIGNLLPKTASTIFRASANPILGGSGGLFGTAEKEGDYYRLNGTWKYATGAPYLTHFTLNAKIIENGKETFNEDGSPVFKSFVIPREAVGIIDDWHTMGLQATATQSFAVTDHLVHQDFSFVYNEFYLPQDIFKINFRVFADLTLWVNYIGMAQHYLAEASKLLEQKILEQPHNITTEATNQLFNYAQQIETITADNAVFTAVQIEELHATAAASVKRLSQLLIELHPRLGIKAASSHHPLNLIFRDYFTATQHHIFTR